MNVKSSLLIMTVIPAYPPPDFVQFVYNAEYSRLSAKKRCGRLRGVPTVIK